MITLNTCYNENCLDTMKRIESDSIHMELTSPPYDNLRKYNGYRFDFELDFKPIAKELYRILIPGGVLVWVVNDQTVNHSESLTSFKQALYFKEECGFKVDTMIYEKNIFIHGGNGLYKNTFEYMFIFFKGKLRTYNLISDRLIKRPGAKITGGSRKKSGIIEKNHGAIHKKISGNTGVRGNVWRYSVGYGHSADDKCAYKHPAIFPEKLAYDHIYTWSNIGDIVYDPFMGSGTTAKAAILLNRQWIGSEISADYCTIIKQRLDGYQYHPELDLGESK